MRKVRANIPGWANKHTTVTCDLYCAALLLALTAPNVELVGISAVHGNVVSLSVAVYSLIGLHVFPPNLCCF